MTLEPANTTYLQYFFMGGKKVYLNYCYFSCPLLTAEQHEPELIQCFSRTMLFKLCPRRLVKTQISPPSLNFSLNGVDEGRELAPLTISLMKLFQTIL